VIVVDTNVTSEVMRREPAAAVLAWLAEQPPGDLYSTAITVAEIGYGVARLPDGQRREFLRATASEVFSAFSDRILSFDTRAAAYYAEVVIERERSGAPISGFDAQIASICLSHGATLATRNVKDFDGVGIALTNPWVWQ
jgi:predicted nucleic acid-binding protein